MKTQARREQIARAALELLATQGVAKFNIVELAKKVELAPSAIYRHFGGREEVLDAALEIFSAKFHGLVEQARDAADNPLDVLKTLIGSHAAMIARGRFLPHMLLTSELTSGNSVRRARILQIFADYMQNIEVIVQEGQRQGSIRKDSDAPTIALLFAGMIQPAALLQQAEGKKLNVKKHVENVWKLFHRAVSVLPQIARRER
ncbi:TetR/AcrR family transcriptional regulator [bacterium]|nr:TetR/AcrR family transcriptional regulator [bacterium]